ncbi:hypothetical protein [Variovorax sp.]|uniref:hypothetical protein n=1 Tax=Variovorax sp. TaxID=1871043 RepID=UPI003BAB6631
MRDDLHKTVPLARPWSRILRSLSKDRRSPEELAPLIVETVQRDLAFDNDLGGQALESALSEGCADLFDQGEKMRLTLLQIQDEPLSVAVRGVCEVALGALAKNGVSASYKQEVIQAASKQHANDQIEHIAARVAAAHGVDEARQVHRTLKRALRMCDFTSEARSSIRMRRPSFDQLLSQEVGLRL